MNVHKYRGRQALHANGSGVYIVTMIAILAPTVLQLVFGKIIFGSAFSWNTLYNAIANGALEQYVEMLSPGQMAYFSLVSFCISVIGALLSYGYTYYCMRASRGEDTNWADLFYGFSWRPMRIVLAQILMNIRISLWSMLFVIPGIVAAFSYVQTYRVMIDNPDMGANAAIGCSRELMRGYRMDYFFLNLSFIGWALLEALTMGASGVYSKPYMEMTMCSFYDSLYDESIDQSYTYHGGDGDAGDPM